MPTYTLGRTFSFGNVSLSYSEGVTAEQETSTGPISIANGQTAFHIQLAIDFSQLKALVMVCDQDVTVKTNSSSVPDDTFNLTADNPLEWTENSYDANPITADVTDLYVANASGAAAELQIYVLQDPTP